MMLSTHVPEGIGSVLTNVSTLSHASMKYREILRFGLSVALGLGLTAGSFLKAADLNDQPHNEAHVAPDSSTSSDNVVRTEGRLSRWLDMNTLSFSYRYRNMADSNGFHLFATGQQRSLVDGRVKLDREGRYSVNFHVSSGRYFSWAYADNIGPGFGDLAGQSLNSFTPAQTAKFFTAIGADPFTDNIASRGWEMYFRQLYFSASPIDQIGLEYGSLAIEKGASTEVTSYDEDGYLAGERLRIRDPKHLFVDQIVTTFGYVGDYFTPNFFARGDRLTQSNYHQFLAQKGMGKRLLASVDYTSHNKVDTMREAVRVSVPESHVLDSARLELYQRTNEVVLQGARFGTGAGFAFTGTKTIHKSFQLEAGYSAIDANFPVLSGSRFLESVAYNINADTIGIGRRPFVRASVKVGPYANLFGFYTHQLSSKYYTLNQQGMNFGATIDFKKLLEKKAHLF